MALEGSRAQSQEPKLWKTLSWYAVLITSGALFISGAILILVGKKVTTAQAVGSIGLGLVTASVSALITSILNSRVQQNILLHKVDGSLSVLQGVVAEEISKVSHYAPIATYDATEDFNVLFNRAIPESLADTNVYAFRGTSAKYVPARLCTRSRRLIA